jgi:periplasmic protein TonB
MVTGDTVQDTAGRARTSLRTRRALSGFLVASLAAHVAVFGVLPGFLRETGREPTVLDVTLVEPKPLPVAPPEPEPPPPPKRKPEPQRAREPTPPAAKAPPAPQPEPAPILSLPATQAPAESAFTVPAPKPAESPRAPEKPQGVATTPPVFNAAYLRNPAPQYPLAARRTGQQGTATVRVLVTPEGLPARVDLEKSSGSTHLDDAAVEAVKGWRFSPARRGNEAVEGWVLVPIVFRLEG